MFHRGNDRTVAGMPLFILLPKGCAIMSKATTDRSPWQQQQQQQHVDVRIAGTMLDP